MTPVADLAGIRARCPQVTLESVIGDVASPEGANAVTTRVDSVDILVNNIGGISVRKPFEELDELLQGEPTRFPPDEQRYARLIDA